MLSQRSGVVTMSSRYARRASPVWGIPNAANRLLQVGLLSSIASRPLSSATSACAVLTSFCTFIAHNSVSRLLLSFQFRHFGEAALEPFGPLETGAQEH